MDTFVSSFFPSFCYSVSFPHAHKVGLCGQFTRYIVNSDSFVFDLSSWTMKLLLCISTLINSYYVIINLLSNDNAVINLIERKEYFISNPLFCISLRGLSITICLSVTESEIPGHSVHWKMGMPSGSEV